MNRRTFVSCLAAAMTAGCLSSGGTTTDTRTGQPATESPTTRTARDVSATYSLSSGWIGWEETISVDETRTVTYTESCAHRTHETETATASRDERTQQATLTEERYERLRQLVTDADPESWQSNYRCQTACMSDPLTMSLTVTVDGTTYETEYYSNSEADVPEEITDIADFLDEKRGKFDSIC